MVIRWAKRLCSDPPPWQGVVVVVCGFLLELSLGAIFSYGNLTTYMTSYMRARVDSSIDYSQLLWVSAMLSLFEGLTLSLGSWMTNRIGARWTSFIGCLLVTSGMSLCYFGVQHSVWLVAVLFGLVNGLGVGIAYVVPLVCGMSWFPTSKGTSNGLIVGGFGLGALVFNPIQTAFLNPHNLSPDDDGYFKDKGLLDKVPYVFLLTGAIYVGLQTIAIAGMIRRPVPTEAGGGSSATGDLELQPSQTEKSSPNIPAKDEEGGARDYSSSLDLRSAVATRQFWFLFITYFCNNLCIGFINPLWKTFGQKFIHDDRFLSAVGSASAVFNLSGRIIWGVVNDRFNYRVAMACTAALLTLTFSTLFLTSHGGEPMFFIWVCLIYMAFPGTFSMIPAEVAHTFGLQHAGVIYGMIWLSGGVAAPIPVFFTETLLDKFGYLVLFLSAAVFPLVSLLCTFLFNGETVRTRRLEAAATVVSTIQN